MTRCLLALLLLAGCPEPPAEPEPTPTPTPRGPGCLAADCDETAWRDADDAVIEGVVPAVTLSTMIGEVALSSLWGDCSVFTLVPWIPDFDDAPVEELVESGEPNSTYSFCSWSSIRQERTEALQARVLEALEDRGEAFADGGRPRFRYLLETQTTAPSSRRPSCSSSSSNGGRSRCLAVRAQRWTG